MFEGGIVVSLPGRHAATLRVSGSVFGFDELRDAVLPPELRTAITLVVEAAQARNLPLKFVARPEVFTHGILAERLMARLQGVHDHVALCDGTAFRPLPGLRNHLFFYRRGVPDACRDLRRLVEVAPEMFLSLASQVNGTLAFRLGGAWHRPPATALGFAETPRTAPAAVLPVICLLSDPGRSAAASLDEDALDAAALPPGAVLRYVPLTESILADGVFMRLLAERLLAATLREQAPLVLQLPAISAGADDIADQIAAVIRALAETGIAFPWHAAASARWATGPLAPEQLRGASILVHPGLDFWRFGHDIWRVAGEVEVVRHSPAGTAFVRLFGDWLGHAVPTRLLNPRLARDQVSVGSVL